MDSPALKLRLSGITSSHISFLELTRKLVQTADARAEAALAERELKMRRKLALRLRLARARYRRHCQQRAKSLALARVIALSVDFQSQLQKQQKGLESACTRLALDIASSILQERISEASAGLARKISTTIAKITPSSAPVLFVAASQAERLCADLNTQCQVTPHPDLEPGNAILRLDTGEIHFNWQRDFEDIKSQLNLALDRT
ncbi:MAG: hypothetical protein K1X79_07000 [Oligoflexia bacterium]|nr:hypothetical protein [Oligoflexia bacterium]